MEIYLFQIGATVERICVNVFNRFGEDNLFKGLHISKCKLLNFGAGRRNFKRSNICIIRKSFFEDVIYVEVLRYGYLTALAVIFLQIAVLYHKFRSYTERCGYRIQTGLAVYLQGTGYCSAAFRNGLNIARVRVYRCKLRSRRLPYHNRFNRRIPWLNYDIEVKRFIGMNRNGCVCGIYKVIVRVLYKSQFKSRYTRFGVNLVGYRYKYACRGA